MGVLSASAGFPLPNHIIALGSPLRLTYESRLQAYAVLLLSGAGQRLCRSYSTTYKT